MRRRARLVAMLRWGGCALLFVLVLEACARLDVFVTWGAPLWGGYTEALLTVTDDHGTDTRPGASFEKWRINRHGFRGPEITVEKPPGVTRVVVAGSSEAFGVYEGEDMEFPAQMRTRLAR